ncbi:MULTISPECIES: biotin/lipoyl-binding carrier protein [Hydrogenophaga]|uniref:Biotin/lipoyl-binding carrier protein n=2 Tax=Hydrogenophaga TaxID=47420 RepID=A0ABW2QFL2_9BURK
MKKILSEVSGSVWKLEVAVGQSVQAGDTLLIVESMKMEIPVESPSSGTVTELLVAEGDAVADGQWLVRLD